MLLGPSPVANCHIFLGPLPLKPEYFMDGPSCSYAEQVNIEKCDQSNTTQRQTHAGETESREPLDIIIIQVYMPTTGLGGVVGLTLPITLANRGSRPVYYLPCSDLGQVVNLSLSVA